MSFLTKINNVSDEAINHGLKMLVYGPSGVGKTTLATTVPDQRRALILNAESGLLSIRGSQLQTAQVKSIQDLREAHKFLSQDKHDFEWVIMDSISEIAEICLEAEMQRNKNPLQAYGALSQTMIPLLKAFRDLPMHVLLIAKMETVKDEETLRYRPSFPGQKLTVDAPYLMDEVHVLLSKRVMVDEQEQLIRKLMTQPSDKYEAKSRSGAFDKVEHPHLGDLVNKIKTKAAEDNT
jgi:ABC-type oligopeptide transport system ATPase subunit